MTQFGSIEWKATVTLASSSSSGALLTGTHTIPFVRGWANFTDLVISQPGDGKISCINQ